MGVDTLDYGAQCFPSDPNIEDITAASEHEWMVGTRSGIRQLH